MRRRQAFRLLRLAKFLREEVKEENFNIRFYCQTWEEQSNYNPQAFEPKCGSTACALGWCSVLFPKRFSLQYALTDYGRHWKLLFDGNEAGIPVLNLRTPAVKFFGISAEDYRYLFGGFSVRTAMEEAICIENLVRRHGYSWDESTRRPV